MGLLDSDCRDASRPNLADLSADVGRARNRCHAAERRNHKVLLRRIIVTTLRHHYRLSFGGVSKMFWTGFVIGIAVCSATGLIMYFVRDYHQRSAFIAGLSPRQRENLRGFESVRGNWHEFRDLLLHS